jgi:hypothetical protein
MQTETLLSGISSPGYFPSGQLSPPQAQVDQLVEDFMGRATDWRSLAALMVGGMAYRFGRIGTMSSGIGAIHELPLRIASIGIGLSAEVTAFEIANRSLMTVGGNGHSRRPPHLWRWDGQGGIRQGLLSSLVTFGTLKGVGRLAQGENIIVQHLLQDTGMVLGHQFSGAFHITPRPTGTLAEQFLHAEATNLQLGVGMALANGVAPGIQGLERGLDLSLQSRSGGIQNFAPLRMGFQPAFATAGRRSNLPAFPAENKLAPSLSLMAADRPEEEGSSHQIPPASERRGSSQPPIEDSVIESDAHSWGVREKRPQEDVILVAKLAQNIRDEIWQTLNLRIDSPEAQSLASGQKIWVQLHPVDGTLENYRIVLAALHDTSREKGDFVQLVLDTTTGALFPILKAQHGKYLSHPGSSPLSLHRPGFLPFYYGIRFTSEGLKSGPLFEELNPQLQDFLKHNRTLMLKTRAALPPSQKSTELTILVLYFPQIAEGIRKYIDAFCDISQTHDKGRMRLQRLVQHVLVAIYEKELQAPEYGGYPNFHIWVTPHPEAQGKKKVHVLTADEARKWYQRERSGQIGPEDILLVLDRTPARGQSTLSLLSQQYTHTDDKDRPIGADLRFQESLGLGTNQLKLPLPDLVPTPGKIADWKAQLAESSEE